MRPTKVLMERFRAAVKVIKLLTRFQKGLEMEREAKRLKKE